MAVPKKQRSIIRATLEFANLHRVYSDTHVQAVFQGLPFKQARHGYWLRPGPDREIAPGLLDPQNGQIDAVGLQEQVRK